MVASSIDAAGQCIILMVNHPSFGRDNRYVREFQWDLRSRLVKYTDVLEDYVLTNVVP